jgi:integrase
VTRATSLLSSLAGSPSGKRVRATGGKEVDLPASKAANMMEWELPQTANRERLEPLLYVASLILAPGRSALERSCTRLLSMVTSFAAWVNVPLKQVNGALLIGLAVARCCPPVGQLLPVGWPAAPVLPTTVKTELGALRRAAKLKMQPAVQLAAALDDELLLAFLKSVGANVGRLKSNKRPLLWKKVREFVDPILVQGQEWVQGRPASGVARERYPWPSIELQRDIRDAFAVALGFATGSRCAELLNLLGNEVQHEMVDETRYLEVTFAQTKTRQTPLSTHQPFKTLVSNETVVELFDVFNEVVGWEPEGPVWIGMRGATCDAAGRAWFAAVVRRVDPECTPHCCRVGLASDMWAAGAKLDQIMTAGRWTSVAAVLYIIGSLDKALAAASLVGKGGLTYDAGKLRQKGFSAAFTAPAQAEVKQWLERLALLD